MEKMTILKEEKSRELTISDAQAKAERVFDLLGVREGTREDYKRKIGLFLDFIKDRGLNRNSFNEFRGYLDNRTDWVVATKNKYLITGRVFLKELNKQGMLPADITQNVKGFEQSKKHKKDGLNQEEITSLTEFTRQLPLTRENARLKAILSLLALEGLRQIEITRLEVKDLDLASGRILIRGKGRDDKDPFDVNPETIKNLKEHLKVSGIKDGAIFTSQSNNHKNKGLTTRSIRGIVKQVLKELRIDKTTHGFRHYFVTELINKFGDNLLAVAQFSRHKSLEMLQVYNDNIQRQADLPRYYETFKEISF